MLVQALTTYHALTTTSENRPALPPHEMQNISPLPNRHQACTNRPLCSTQLTLNIISVRKISKYYHVTITGTQEGYERAFTFVASPLPSTAMTDVTPCLIATTTSSKKQLKNRNLLSLTNRPRPVYRPTKDLLVALV